MSFLPYDFWNEKVHLSKNNTFHSKYVCLYLSNHWVADRFTRRRRADVGLSHARTGGKCMPLTASPTNCHPSSTLRRAKSKRSNYNYAIACWACNQSLNLILPIRGFSPGTSV